jgi:hypothetical protein
LLVGFFCYFLFIRLFLVTFCVLFLIFDVFSLP